VLVAPLPGRVIWDHWPVQAADGSIADIAGGRLGIFLSAARRDDPDQRHGEARLRLMWGKGGQWHDRGALLPPSLSPGSREWAGSARLDDDGRLHLYFTAAGHCGEPKLSFQQRLFQLSAQLHADETSVTLSDWHAPAPIVVPDGDLYVADLEGGGAVGTIKAFRDPAWFCDPAGGALGITFAASLGRSGEACNAAVGLALYQDGAWRLQAPLATGDGVSNEMERPHIVVHGGRMYLFWSVLAKVFAPGHSWPTGLYGAVADSLAGPWQLLNGDGLVVCNPAQQPEQAYSWVVNADLSVWSFADMIGLPPVFAGCPAPVFQLRLAGDQAAVVA
jgi:levansucrase